MRFHATVDLYGKTATGIRVPDEIVEGLGGGKRAAVKVTINGYTYRSSIASMDGRMLLPVSAEVRERARVAAGDLLTVDIELDTQPRVIDVPEDLRVALVADSDAQRYFDGLTYSNKRRVVDPLAAAKTAETRQRRLDKTIATLHEGRI